MLNSELYDSHLGYSGIFVVSEYIENVILAGITFGFSTFNLGPVLHEVSNDYIDCTSNIRI